MGSRWLRGGADGDRRFLLACRGLPSTATAGARPVLERLFRASGLPARIRSDNGVPFATIALARLSALSVWWLRLAILPDPTEPSSPRQNGRHERMHRTRKAEATKPAHAQRPSAAARVRPLPARVQRRAPARSARPGSLTTAAGTRRGAVAPMRRPAGVVTSRAAPPSRTPDGSRLARRRRGTPADEQGDGLPAHELAVLSTFFARFG